MGLPTYIVHSLLVVFICQLLTCSLSASGTDLRLTLVTGEGSSIHVLKVGEEQELAIFVNNTGEQEISGILKWTIEGITSGKTTGEGASNIQLPSKESCRIKLELPKSLLFDTYKVNTHWNNEPLGGADPKSELRFAYMIPAGPTTKKAQGFIFGVCEHPQWYDRTAQDLTAMAAAWCGAKAVREDIGWGKMQPQKGQWSFESFDYVVETFGKQGIEIMPIYSYCAKWAVAKDWKPFDPTIRHVQRPDYEYWRVFTRGFIERYHNKIRYVEIWNEPDLSSFANFSVEEYLEMQKIAYKEIKAVDASVKVLNGGIAHTGPDVSGPRKGIIGKILSSNTSDIFAFHGHGRYPVYRHQINYVIKQLEQHPMPWYANETAVSATGIGEIEQAKTLFQKLTYSWAQGSIGYNWYNLRNKGFNPKDGEHNFGLITHDFKPKVAYLTYNTLATHFREAKFVNNFLSENNIRSYRFEAANGDCLLTFWCEGSEVSDRLLLLGNIDGNVEQIDMLGNRFPLANHKGEILLKISPVPLFLRINGQKKTPVLRGEFLHKDSYLLVNPGIQTELKLQLVNPSSAPQDIRLAGLLPQGISGNISGQYSLESGEKRTLSFPIQVRADFHSETSAPENLTIQLTVGNLGEQKILYPFTAETPIPYGKFAQSPSFTLSTPPQYHSFIVNEPKNAHLHWQGPQDLSAEVWLARRNKRLLVNIIVTDDIHSQKERGKNVWEGDNVQIALKLPKQNNFWEIGLTRLNDGSSEAFVWIAPAEFDTGKTAEQIQLTTNRDELKKQTIYQAEIPFDAIGMSEGIGRDGFRFNLIVNDNDHGVREGFIMMAPGIGEDKDASKYPLVRFY